MTTLHPTKTRVALLADIAAHSVFDMPDGSIAVLDRGVVLATVTARAKELQAAGWATPGFDQEWPWQLTDAGEALLTKHHTTQKETT